MRNSLTFMYSADLISKVYPPSPCVLVCYLTVWSTGLPKFDRENGFKICKIVNPIAKNIAPCLLKNRHSRLGSRTPVCVAMVGEFKTPPALYFSLTCIYASLATSQSQLLSFCRGSREYSGYLSQCSLKYPGLSLSLFLLSVVQ